MTCLLGGNRPARRQTVTKWRQTLSVERLRETFIPPDVCARSKRGGWRETRCTLADTPSKTRRDLRELPTGCARRGVQRRLRRRVVLEIVRRERRRPRFAGQADLKCGDRCAAGMRFPSPG